MGRAIVGLALAGMIVLAGSASAVPLRQIVIETDGLSWVTQRGTVRQLRRTDIPSDVLVTDGATETWINDTWAPLQGCGCQVRVHVFSRSPLRITVGVWNLGVAIPANWYVD